MTLSIIVLAAGKGTRMKSKKPKVLHNVANLPMLYHVLNTVKKLKPNKCSIVISNEMKKYISITKEKFPFIEFFIQKKQLGTADAVRCGITKPDDFLNDNTLILYGDTPLIQATTLKKMINNLKIKKANLDILSMEPKNTKNYGRVIVKENKVIEIVEFSEASKEVKKINLCNTGVMALNTNELVQNISKVNNKNSKGEFFLTDLIKIFNSQNKVVTHTKCNYFETLGVNDKKDLTIVESIYQNTKRDFFLKKGITLINPSTVFFSYDTEISEETIIHPNVYFGKNVIIGRNVVVKSFCHIEKSKIKDDSEVGPFARIREKSEIGENTRIGNFVEVKKSKIKNLSKISHLSYVGDATIGIDTNIGAGTITCNYDGKKKNKTKIGDNCFIGSNTSLIAPVVIENDSIVGAGTVLKSNISEGITVFRKSELVKKKNKKR